MIGNLRKIFSLITPQEKKQAYWLLLAILIMGLLETTGIASIMPFMAVLANPEIIETNKFLSQAYTVTGLTSHNQFLFFLGGVVLFVLIVSNSFSALTSWLMLRFVYLRGHALSSRLFGKYLNAPYSFFLNQNSSELVKNIITENHRIVIGVLLPAMRIISRTVIALCIFALLIAMDPLLAIIVFMVCGGLYGTVYKLSKKKLAVSGKKSTEAQGQRFKLTGEAFGGIKELKLLGREGEYLKRYLQPSYDFAACESTSQAITILPKYALETIVFGGMLLIMLYQIGIKKDIAQVLPMLVLYAFAGYRLMPGFNQIFHGFSQMRYHSAALDIIHRHFQICSDDQEFSQVDIPPVDALSFKKDIELKDVTFSYPKSDATVIDNLSLFIKANTTVAFVGKTGSGKTTLIDIILGLLKVDSGEMSIDTTLIERSNLGSWQKNIGYVPQQIYLADDTVTRNIAFGVPDEEIDLEAVSNAARIADIDDFVCKELSRGYETVLGERGVRLSGGQRQRIGIARALYHDPKVLVLDEATSALDGVTENVIMDAIHRLAHQKTIILIAHRLTTVTESDAIHVLDDGKIVASGKYQELIISCEEFRNMTKHTTKKSQAESKNISIPGIK
jgi:ABC-type multidrug transport system fused ATPase/permease subunit